MSNWIFVQTEHNWNVDFKNSFEFLGVKESKFYQKNISYGDIIFTYISKIKKFSDIRKVIDNKLHITPKSYNYDKEFKKSMNTVLVKLLEKNEWIDFSKISKQLSVFVNTTSPANKLLNAPILLNMDDFKILKNHFKI